MSGVINRLKTYEGECEAIDHSPQGGETQQVWENKERRRRCVCVCALLFTCFQHTAATGEPFSLILLSLKHSQRSDIRCWLR